MLRRTGWADVPWDDNTMKTIAIIGSGYCGVSLAANLLKLSKTPLTIWLFDRQSTTELGPAYRTSSAIHLLNVPAGGMSTWPDEPDHFVHWLKASPQAQPYLKSDLALSEQYVPRLLYRDYMSDVLRAALDAHPQSIVHQVQDEVVRVSQTDANGRGYQLSLQQHAPIQADQVVLALGNLPPRSLYPELGDAVVNNPWNYQAIAAIPTNHRVLIVGTGLTMVDVAISLAHQGHQGTIIAISRRGLLPQPHTYFAQHYMLPDQLPQNLRQLIRFVRAAAQECVARGGDYREVMAALRFRVHPIWQGFSQQEKQRFLHHLVPYWDIHRHRIAPEIAAKIVKMRTEQLSVHAAKIKRAEPTEQGIVVTYQSRGQTPPNLQHITVDTIINCTGPNPDYQATMPLLQQLQQENLICSDALSVGIATNQYNQVLNTQNQPVPELYAMGALTKGRLWEIIAVPDLRTQSAKLAKTLTGVN